MVYIILIVKSQLKITSLVTVAFKYNHLTIKLFQVEQGNV